MAELEPGENAKAKVLLSDVMFMAQTLERCREFPSLSQFHRELTGTKENKRFPISKEAFLHRTRLLERYGIIKVERLRKGHKICLENQWEQKMNKMGTNPKHLLERFQEAKSGKSKPSISETTLDPTLSHIEARLFYPKEISWQRKERDPKKHKPRYMLILNTKTKKAYYVGDHEWNLILSDRIEWFSEDEQDLGEWAKANGYELVRNHPTEADLLNTAMPSPAMFEARRIHSEELKKVLRWWLYELPYVEVTGFDQTKPETYVILYGKLKDPDVLLTPFTGTDEVQLSDDYDPDNLLPSEQHPLFADLRNHVDPSVFDEWEGIKSKIRLLDEMGREEAFRGQISKETGTRLLQLQEEIDVATERLKQALKNNIFRVVLPGECNYLG